MQLQSGSLQFSEIARMLRGDKRIETFKSCLADGPSLDFRTMEAWRGCSMKRTSLTKNSETTDPSTQEVSVEGWTFMTNHTHVLLCLYHNPDRRLRDVAQLVGITERMVQKVVADLAAAGYLQITKEE